MGIKAGWQMLKLNGAEFSEERFATLKRGSASYTITFATQEGPRCPGCSKTMHWSSYAGGAYKDGWDCCNVNDCGSRRANMGAARWFCVNCQNDICSECSSKARTPPTAQPSDTAGSPGSPGSPPRKSRTPSAPSTPSVGSPVRVAGRLGKVVTQDLDDPSLTFKVAFSDGASPAQDWFAGDKVEVDEDADTTNSTAEGSASSSSAVQPPAALPAASPAPAEAWRAMAELERQLARGNDSREDETSRMASSVLRNLLVGAVQNDNPALLQMTQASVPDIQKIWNFGPTREYLHGILGVNQQPASGSTS